MNARVQKLKALLERVQEKRRAPRVVAIRTPDDDLSSSLSSDDRRSSLPSERPSRPSLSTPLEDAMAELSPASGVRPWGMETPIPGALPAPTDELTLEDFAPPPPVRQAPKSAAPTAPPPAPPPEPVHAPEPALSAPTARIEPEPVTTPESVVRAVSPHRTAKPKTFGDLIELTLSLRPRE